MKSVKWQLNVLVTDQRIKANLSASTSLSELLTILTQNFELDLPHEIQKHEGESRTSIQTSFHFQVSWADRRYSCKMRVNESLGVILDYLWMAVWTFIERSKVERSRWCPASIQITLIEYRKNGKYWKISPPSVGALAVLGFAKHLI